MKITQYLKESIKSKIVKGTFGNQRIIEGYKNYKRLYVFKKKGAYLVSLDNKISLDSMVEIDGEYWFSTLKELHKALNK